MRHYRSFKKARAFARGLGLKNKRDWYAFARSNKKPDKIPATPNVVYASDGWSNWGDWLGTDYVAKPLRHYRSFRRARAFVRSRKLKSKAEWNKYYRSGKLPADIPANPRTVYMNDGWSGFGDWLGTGRLANQHRKFRSFKKARVFARGLGLKSTKEWYEYCKVKRRGDIPSNPDKIYTETGWAGYPDWLGYA